MRLGRGAGLVAGFAIVCLAVPCAAGPAPPDSASWSVPVEPPSPAEQRCDDLAEALRLRAAEIRAAGADTLSVVEAEEIGRVADDLVAEGELTLAEDLLREALALITPPKPAAP